MFSQVRHEYGVVLEQSTVKALFDNLKLNLSLEEIIYNARILAHYLLGRKLTLEISLRPVQVKPLFENESVIAKILTKSYHELGMNKLTLWYQKKRLGETGSIGIYRNTRHHFV